MCMKNKLDNSVKERILRNSLLFFRSWISIIKKLSSSAKLISFSNIFRKIQPSLKVISHYRAVKFLLLFFKTPSLDTISVRYKILPRSLLVIIIVIFTSHNVPAECQVVHWNFPGNVSEKMSLGFHIPIKFWQLIW